jgi:DNA-binding beta-propeller fold protein YncE/ABC-type spermidine/putrescine transport system permease subunit II
MVLAHGWKNVGRQVLDVAETEANKGQRFRYVILPLLRRNIFLCYVVCLVLILSEFATFHLAGIRTVGTELAVLYELTGSEAATLRAGWPMVAVAAVVGYFMHCEVVSLTKTETISEPYRRKTAKNEWIVVGLLVVFSVVLPVSILVMNIQGSKAFSDFFRLHTDELGWSLLTSFFGVVLAFIIAAGAKRIESLGGIGKWLRVVVYTSIFAGMLLPGSMVGLCILKAATWAGTKVSGAWLMVSVGQAVRFCGVALILLKLNYTADEHHYIEMASVDGAGRWARLRYIYFAQNRHFAGAVFLLLLMMSITELSTTMVVLGAGVPNFAQRLLNQMHYARDSQVIASCLILTGTFVLITTIVILLLKQAGRNRLAYMLILLCMLACGCDKERTASEVRVVNMFGRTGRGKLEFVYPRAIEIDGDMIYVIDKVGRIQKITTGGQYVSEYRMPEIENGKPTGMSIGPDGNMYVADTHYHRVTVFDGEGNLVKQFGEFGEDQGQFIYPTDVEFTDDGRVYVSEYGGNDRISVFDKEGKFLYCFGTAGSGEGEFSRPSAICVDSVRKFLYVADSCNHRIAVYTFDGELVRYFGQVGTEEGMLRYPYDLALTEDGDVVVCEYGNNRIQIFSPEGKSLGIYGRAGRVAGELAYPWAVAVDADKKAYVVDAGNNRIQVWQL